MALWVQIILVFILVILCGFLVPLLVQLRRTAASVEHLAESAREDIRKVAADVHQIRNRADGLADLAAASLEMPLTLSRMVSGTARTLEAFLGQGGPSWLGAVVSGLKFALNFIRRHKKVPPSKEEPDER